MLSSRPGAAGPRGVSRVVRAKLTAFAPFKIAYTAPRCCRGLSGTHFRGGPADYPLWPQVTLTLSGGHLPLYRPARPASGASCEAALTSARAYLKSFGACGAAPGKVGLRGVVLPTLAKIALFSRRYQAYMRDPAHRAVPILVSTRRVPCYIALPIGADYATSARHPCHVTFPTWRLTAVHVTRTLDGVTYTSIVL